MNDVQNESMLEIIFSDIRLLTKKDISNFSGIPANGELYPPVHVISGCKSYIFPKINEIINSYYLYESITKNNISTVFLDYFTKLHIELKKLLEMFDNRTTLQNLEAQYQKVVNLIEDFNSYKKIDLQFKNDLTLKQVEEVRNDIIDMFPDFDTKNELKNIYESSTKDRKIEILNNLSTIRRLAAMSPLYLHDAVALNDIIANIFNYNSEIAEAKNLVSEAKEISANFGTQITQITTDKILTTFSSTTLSLKDEIRRLNNWIIVLFCSIMLMFALKTILIFFFEDKFKDIYNFLLFLTLIFSCSALLTYFIKEKNHLRKLYDFYLLKGLELNSLPDYMRELSLDQRRELTIQLAPTYFLGDRDEKSNINNTEEKSLSTYVEELSKIVKEIKSLKD